MMLNFDECVLVSPEAAAMEDDEAGMGAESPLRATSLPDARSTRTATKASAIKSERGSTRLAAHSLSPSHNLHMTGKREIPFA